MNTNGILQEPRATWREMADEHVHLELLEAQERIADLEVVTREGEANASIYRDMAVMLLNALNLMTLRFRRERRRRIELEKRAS